MRSLDVLAIAESRVIYRFDYIGAERGGSTMESLQQATDGDGQRRNAQRYQESNITPRRYIEDKTGTGNRTKRLVRGSLSLSGRSFIEQIQTNPVRGKIPSSWARNFSSLCISTVRSRTASIQASRTTQSVRGTYRYDLLHCTFTRSLVSCLYFFFFSQGAFTLADHLLGKFK